MRRNKKRSKKKVTKKMKKLLSVKKQSGAARGKRHAQKLRDHGLLKAGGRSLLIFPELVPIS